MSSQVPLSHWNVYFSHWDPPPPISPRIAHAVSTRPRDAAELAFAQAVEAWPKIELHVHMEAAVPAQFYRDMGGEVANFAPARKRSSAKADIKAFLAAWSHCMGLFRDESRFFDLAKAFVASRRQQNIVYSEVHISPGDTTFERTKDPTLGEPLDFQRVLAQYVAGLKHALAVTPGIEVRLIVDLLWDNTPEDSNVMLDAIENLRTSGASLDPSGRPLIIAVGLGGTENAIPPQQKLPILAKARRLGLRVDIHSGEQGRGAAHRTAAELLQPDRIGHGITGLLSPPHWRYPGPIAACPISNLLTGACPNNALIHHPIAKMRHDRHPVSVNTDDPLLLGTTLTLEFVALRRVFGWDLADFRDLQRNAAAMVFARDFLATVLPAANR